MVVVVGGGDGDKSRVLHVHLLGRIGQSIGCQVAFPKCIMMGTGSTHHLEGVGEGKVMVLGVGLMLSLFVVDR